MSHFQERVNKWMGETFEPAVVMDHKERSFRFGEEALELLQAGGCSKEDVLRLVDYVYGRPVGEFEQEVGGTMVTLGAWCGARDMDVMEAAHKEQTRCERPEIRAKIQAKQAAKRAMMKPTPLPGSTDVGKYVTLQMALQLGVADWLPQQSVWRVMKDDSDHWEVVYGFDTDHWMGTYRLPKNLCSQPREAA